MFYPDQYKTLSHENSVCLESQWLAKFLSRSSWPGILWDMRDIYRLINTFSEQFKAPPITPSILAGVSWSEIEWDPRGHTLGTPLGERFGRQCGKYFPNLKISYFIGGWSFSGGQCSTACFSIFRSITILAYLDLGIQVAHPWSFTFVKATCNIDNYYHHYFNYQISWYIWCRRNCFWAIDSSTANGKWVIEYS